MFWKLPIKQDHSTLKIIHMYYQFSKYNIFTASQKQNIPKMFITVPLQKFSKCKSGY